MYGDVDSSPPRKHEILTCNFDSYKYKFCLVGQLPHQAPPFFPFFVRHRDKTETEKKLRWLCLLGLAPPGAMCLVGRITHVPGGARPTRRQVPGGANLVDAWWG